MSVPYFTTKDFIKSVLQLSVLGKSVDGYYFPRTALPGFKVVLMPFLSYTLEGYEHLFGRDGNTSDPSTTDYGRAFESLAEYSVASSVDIARACAVSIGFFFVPESPSLEFLIKQGFVFDCQDIKGASDFNSFIASVKTQKFCFYYDNYNLGSVSFDDGFGDFDTWLFMPMSHDFLPIDTNLIDVANSVAGVSAQFSRNNIKVGFSENFNAPSQLFTKSCTRWLSPMLAHTITDFASESYTWSWALSYPAGYLFTQIDTDPKFVSTTDTLSVFDVFNLGIGQSIIKKYFGAKTLADYLGITLTQQVKRQPLPSYDKLSGNILGSRYVNRSGNNRPLGTYAEQGDLFEVGIVNDSPISLIPFLAYHKTWSDLFREPRYELRCIYSDPYRSPFLVPFNGSYHYGNMLGGNAETASSWTASGFITASPNYYDDVSFYDDAILNYVSLYNVFTYRSFIDLVSLRERRVVADYYTLLTPLPQDGFESVVDAVTDVGSISSMHTGNFYDVTERNGDPASGDLWVDGGQLLAGTFNNLGTSEEVYMTSRFAISALRMANKIQKFLERNNVVGSDYVKQILTHFGAKPTEYPATACWYLGGKLFTPNVSPVEMVGANSEMQATGQQSAQMYSSGQVNAQNFTAKEHGILLQFFTIQNDFDSVQGLRPQMITKFDFPFPEFADLGAEAVPLNQLVHTDGTYTNGQTVFGYAPRYARSKCMLNEVHGDFKKSLAYWTTTRKFNPSLLHGTWGHGDPENVPEIGRNFLYENADYSAFTYTEDDYDHCLLDIKHYISVVRNLPTLPTPSIE